MNTRAIQWITIQGVDRWEYIARNTEKPRVRAIDGSHGVWPRPPLPNRKIGNYPDYFRFWAERAIIAIISDHCRWTENFFIGQQWVDNKLSQLLTGICGDDWCGLTVKIEWEKQFENNLENWIHFMANGTTTSNDEEVIEYFFIPAVGWQGVDAGVTGGWSSGAKLWQLWLWGETVTRRNCHNRTISPRPLSLQWRRVSTAQSLNALHLQRQFQFSVFNILLINVDTNRKDKIT